MGGSHIIYQSSLNDLIIMSLECAAKSRIKQIKKMIKNRRNKKKYEWAHSFYYCQSRPQDKKSALYAGSIQNCTPNCLKYDMFINFDCNYLVGIELST